MKIVIIGAGIGGLAVANLLAKDGHEVIVLEKSDQPGGRAGKLEKDGFTFDTGPSWYLMAEVFAHYFALLDRDVAKELDLQRLSPAYRVFFEDAAPITITSDIHTDAATFEAIELGAGDALKTYVARSKEIYDLSLEHFLYSNFLHFRELLHPAILQRLLRMLQMAFTPLHSYVSSFVQDQRLQQILEYPTVFLGTSPFAAPAMYSLMSALDFSEGVFYPRGGMYTIIERLVGIGRELGVTYRFGIEVQQIVVTDSTAESVKTTTGEILTADRIISNADLHFTETVLLPKKAQSFPASYWRKKQPSPSALLLYLGVQGSLPELTHHSLLFVRDWKKNFTDIYTHKQAPENASMYLCKTTATDPDMAPSHTENLFVLVPLPAGVVPDVKTTKKLIERYLLQIESMTGIELRSRIVSQTVFGPRDFAQQLYSWQASMLGQSHTLRQSAFFRTPNKSKRLTNLYYVGANTTPGVGLPMCLIGAEMLYKRLSGDSHSGKVLVATQEGSVDA